MTPQSPRILACDHRGSGLLKRLGPASDRATVKITNTLRESLQSLQRERPDLIVLDPLAGGGTTESSALRRDGVPLLVVWDPLDARTPRRLARLLADHPWDLMPRDAEPEEVRLRIERLLAHGRLVTEMSALRHRAVHDDRTELLRPQAFEARLVEHFSAAQRHHHELALILMDLDKFGQINKRHDHTVGDQIIARVGEVIRTSLRVEDVAGRLGGDEFAVLLPYTGKLDCVQVVNRLLERIAELSGSYKGADHDIQVSTSIGFETYDGGDLESVETLRRHAERALRRAKGGGGDRGIYFRTMDEGQAEEA